jgi:uncharacterized iron-regulated membrane protein
LVRRVILHIHLWSGLIAALYLVVISVTGSVAVFRREVVRHEAYLPAMEWVVDLHDNLLAGDTGQQVNGAGGLALTVLALTGIVIWWRGARTWHRGFLVRRGSRWPRFTFDLHSAAGIWVFLFLLLWGVTGLYFAFPQPFVAAIDVFEPEDLARPGFRRGDWVLEWLVRLHFGRFGGWTSRIIWATAGLVPLVLVVTGAAMWWNRARRGRREWGFGWGDGSGVAGHSIAANGRTSRRAMPSKGPA